MPMSGKELLRSGRNFFLYQEKDDKDGVYLKIEKKCGCMDIMRIPLTIFNTFASCELCEKLKKEPP